MPAPRTPRLRRSSLITITIALGTAALLPACNSTTTSGTTTPPGTQPPPTSPTVTVTITSPSDGDQFGGPASFYLTATATPPSGATTTEIDFYKADANGNNPTLISKDTDGSDGWTALLTNLPTGTYQLQAQATDSNNDASLITSVSVTITSGAPSGSPAQAYWSSIGGAAGVNAYLINDNGGPLTGTDTWFLDFLKTQMDAGMPAGTANTFLTQVAGDNGAIWQDEKNVINWNYNGIHSNGKTIVYGYTDFKANGWMPNNIYPTYVDLPKMLHPFFNQPALTLPVNTTSPIGTVTPNYSSLPAEPGAVMYGTPDWAPGDSTVRLSGLYQMNSAWSACNLTVDNKGITSHDTVISRDYATNNYSSNVGVYDVFPFPVVIKYVNSDAQYGWPEMNLTFLPEPGTMSPSYGHADLVVAYVHLRDKSVTVNPGDIVQPQQRIAYITFAMPASGAVLPELDWTIWTPEPSTNNQYGGNNPWSLYYQVDSTYIDPKHRARDLNPIGSMVPLAQDPTNHLITSIQLPYNTSCEFDGPMIYNYGN